jgi:hypothetical protein
MTSSHPSAYRMRAITAALRRSRRSLLASLPHVVALPDLQFTAGFVAAVAEVEAAFRREEAVMNTLGYTGLRDHRRDNARLLAALHHAEAAVEGGNIELGRNALAVLTDLVSLHRLTADLALVSADRPLAPRLRRQAALAAAPARRRLKGRRPARV